MIKFCRNEDYKNRRAVFLDYPYAAKILKVCGGWMVFDTIFDYEDWLKQK